MQVKDTGLKFTRTLTPRKTTDTLIVHHAAGNGMTVEQMHSMHINSNGWCGIGYNFYIRKDGTIYQGRGWDTVGAHAGSSNNYNSRSTGICFEGNFEAEQMPEAQLLSGIWLIKEAFLRYGKLAVKRHGEVSATACPGKNFPFVKMTDTALSQYIGTPTVEQPAENLLSGWAVDAWVWAVGSGITDGTNPQSPCTREMMVTMLHRYDNLKG